MGCDTRVVLAASDQVRMRYVHMATPKHACSRIQTAQNPRSVRGPHTVAPGLETRRSSRLWSSGKVLALDLRVFWVRFDHILMR